MQKIDWMSKLTSRKFWLALAGLVSGLMLAFKVDENTVNDVTGIIMACASVIAYVIGEGLADAAGAKGTVVIEPETHPPEDPSEDDLK